MEIETSIKIKVNVKGYVEVGQTLEELKQRTDKLNEELKGANVTVEMNHCVFIRPDDDD